MIFKPNSSHVIDRKINDKNEVHALKIFGVSILKREKLLIYITCSFFHDIQNWSVLSESEWSEVHCFPLEKFYYPYLIRPGGGCNLKIFTLFGYDG